MTKALGLLLVLGAGCAQLTREGWEADLRKDTSVTIGCPAEQIRVGNFGYGTFNAVGCGRAYNCDRSAYPKPPTCIETAASQAVSLRKLVIDRLALDTGCPKEQIAIAQEADWTRGQERAYRLNACGKAYACTSVPGHATECRRALSE